MVPSRTRRQVILASLFVLSLMMSGYGFPEQAAAANPWKITVTIENSSGVWIARVNCNVAWSRVEAGFSETITCKVTDNTSSAMGVWMQFSTRPPTGAEFTPIDWSGPRKTVCKRETAVNGSVTCTLKRTTALTNYVVRIDYGLTRNGRKVSTFSRDAMNVPGRTPNP